MFSRHLTNLGYLLILLRLLGHIGECVLLKVPVAVCGKLGKRGRGSVLTLNNKETISRSRQPRRQWEVAVVGEVPKRAKELGNEKKSCLVGGSMKIQEVARRVCSGCCESEMSDVGTQQCLECCG